MKLIYEAYAWLLERRSFYVFCVFVALLPLVGAGARRAILSNSNDVSAWLPDGYPETKALNWYQEKFNHGSDHVVLLSWGACRLRDDWRQFVGPAYDALVEKYPEKYTYQNQALHLSDQRLSLLSEKLLSKDIEPALFADVVTGPEMLIQLTAKYDGENQSEQVAKGKTPHGLGLKPDVALRRLEGTLVGPDYLHGLKLARDKQGRAVIAAVEVGSQAAKANLRAGDVVQSVNQRPTSTYQAAVDDLRDIYGEVSSGKFKIAVDGPAGPRAVELTWDGMKPGRQTCALVTLSEYAVGGKRLRGSVAKISQLAQECDIPTDRANPEMLRMGGPPVDNVSIDIEGERTLIRLAILSFIVGLGVCWLCFRDIKITLMVFLTALFSEGTSLALVYYTGGRVDAILMSMPSLIYVLTISGAIHIVNYYRDSVVETGLTTAAARAVAKGFVPCLLAAATTAVGLASLYISPLMPIRNFGVFSAISTLTSLVWIFLFLPAALQLWPLSEKKVLQLKKKAALADENPDTEPESPWARIGERMKRLPRATGAFVLRRNALVTAGCVATLVFFGAGIPLKMTTNVTLMKLFADDADIIHDYTWLESKLGALVPMEVVLHVGNTERVALTGRPTGGTFTLNYTDLQDAQHSTAPLPYDAQGRQIQQALQDTGLRHVVVKTTGRAPNLTHEISVNGEQTPVITAVSELEGGEIRQTHRMGMGEAMMLVDDVRSAIENLDDVDTTLSTVTLAPELRNQNGRPTASIVGAITKLISPVAVEFRKAGYLAFDNDRRDELYRVSLRLGAFSDVDYSEFVDHIHQVTEPVIEEERRRGIFFRATGRSDWTAVEDYPGWYQLQQKQVHISQNKAGVYTVTNREGKTLYTGKPDWGLDVTYTGVVPLIYKAQNELLIGLFESYAMAFVLIAGVMMILMWRVAGPLKSAPAGFLLMLPNLFPTAMVFGFMAWMNISVDIGAMMTASVALGIAVDDTVHYMAWFRRACEAGHTRKESAWIAYGHCGIAMTQTTIIAGCGMGMFAFSTFNPTMKFGVLMIPLLLTALVGDLVMLPALAVGAMGRFFRRGDDGTAVAPSVTSPQPHASAEPLQAKSRIQVDHTSV